MSGNGPNIPREVIRAESNQYWDKVRARAAKNGISEENAEQKLENEFMAAHEVRRLIAIKRRNENKARNNAAKAAANKHGGRRTRRRRTRRRHTRR